MTRQDPYDKLEISLDQHIEKIRGLGRDYMKLLEARNKLHREVLETIFGVESINDFDDNFSEDSGNSTIPADIFISPREAGRLMQEFENKTFGNAYSINSWADWFRNPINLGKEYISYRERGRGVQLSLKGLEAYESRFAKVNQ